MTLYKHLDNMTLRHDIAPLFYRPLLNLSIQVFAIDILYERLSIVGHTKIATHLIYTHFTSRNAYINRAAAGMCLQRLCL